MLDLKGLTKKDMPKTATTEVLLGERIQHLDLSKLVPGKYQPRKAFDQQSLDELAESIKKNGVMQPIVVRPIGDGLFEIVAGERRFRASKLAGQKTVPAVIRELSDSDTVVMALIENIQRENLSPMEEAVSIKRLKDEFSLTQQEVCTALGKNKNKVSLLLAIVDMPDPFMHLYDRGVTSPDTLNELLIAYKSDPKAVLDYIQDKKEITTLSARALKDSIKESKNSGKEQPQKKAPQEKNTQNSRRRESPQIHVTYKRKQGIMNLKKLSDAPDMVFVTFDGIDELVKVTDLKLAAIVAE